MQLLPRLGTYINSRSIEEVKESAAVEVRWGGGGPLVLPGGVLCRVTVQSTDVHCCQPREGGSAELSPPVKSAADIEGRQRPAGPAAAMWQVFGSLTPEQATRLKPEIKLLADAALPVRSHAGFGRPIGEGVRPRHHRWCPSSAGELCACDPRWEAWVYCRRDHAKVRKSFAYYWEAKAWRHEQLELARIGRLRSPSRRTLAETASLWLVLAVEGKIRNRSGRCYKPSALRTIEQDLRLRLVPSLGDRRMAEITRPELQRLVCTWLDTGLSPSKVRGIVNAARVLVRDFDLLAGGESQQLIDPTHGLRLPANRRHRQRIATAAEGRRLIEALEPRDRALWATAMYAGLRYGELRALQARDVDLERRRIHVQRGWDQYEGEVDPKSEKGIRSMIITHSLQVLLAQHLQRTGRKGADLLFGRTAKRPFTGSTINGRARAAWAARGEESIGLQQCRHTAVSQMLDAGVPIDRVSKFIGHASIAITVDRYHLRDFYCREVR
jgi:integrase